MPGDWSYSAARNSRSSLYGESLQNVANKSNKPIFYLNIRRVLNIKKKEKIIFICIKFIKMVLDGASNPIKMYKSYLKFSAIIFYFIKNSRACILSGRPARRSASRETCNNRV